MEELNQRETEKALLGSMLKNPQNFGIVSEIIRPEYFSWDCYRDLYEMMTTLHNESLGIDTITIGDILDKNNALSGFSLHDVQNISGRLAISELRDWGKPENTVSYAHILKNYGENEKLLRILTESAGWVKKGRNSGDILADLEKNLLTIETNDAKVAKSTITFNEAISKAYDITDNAIAGKKNFIYTGIFGLDKLMIGLSAPDLTIVAARPGVGKTAFLSTIVYNIMKNENKKIVFFSLEMGSEQVAMRFISMESGIAFEKQRTGYMTREELEKYHEAVGELTKNNNKLFLNDLAQITPNKIRQELRRIGKVDAIFIDYLQLASSDEKRESRHLEVGSISRGLKAIAKEFHIPVVAAAQLSRASETRSGDNSQPIMSDLAESGSIERDADNIVFLDRKSDDFETNVILAKQRNGAVGKFKINYIGQKTMFVNQVRV